MIRLAYCISSYRLVDFVRLGLKQLRRLDPEAPILVSDDRSGMSGAIAKIAEEHYADYRCPKTQKGHFAGDFQSLVNALCFAQAACADVAIKISQRLILRKPEVIDVIRKTFEDTNIVFATPGQPTYMAQNIGRSTNSFRAFGVLSDIVMIRVGALSPMEMLVMYRSRILRENVPWRSFLECFVDEFHANRFPGKTTKIQELTDPTSDPLYLRRYQSTEHQYRELAMSHGMNGRYPLVEWGQIEGRNYLCKPIII